MVQGKVEICGVNTSKLPVVKSTQQDQFFERIKQGDEQARQEYIEGNLLACLKCDQAFCQGVTEMWMTCSRSAVSV